MTENTGATTVKGRGPLRIRRRARDPWNADEVATHLMGCRTQMLRGLGRKSPWAGIDDDTLDSCFTHAAAVIVKVAVSGQRPEWRSPGDLEKAQIAAFRHQAQDHWKRVNAQSRQGDRLAVRFNADLHGTDHAPLERLFEQPDLHMIERDLLAELEEDELRRFWEPVLRERLSFRESGDRLGLTRAEVIGRTRAGRSAFSEYLDARASGELCRRRSGDIVASRAGTPNPMRAERAAAHLEACYACALVHDPSTSAFERGILGLGPTGLILRMITRAGDAASTPVMRVVDSGSGSRAVAAGVAALTIGAGVGAGVSLDTPRKNPDPADIAPKGQRLVQAPAVTRARTRDRIVSPVVVPASAGHRSSRNIKPRRKPSALVRKRHQVSDSSPAALSTAEREFLPEVGSRGPTPTSPAATPTNPANTEFPSP